MTDKRKIYRKKYYLKNRNRELKYQRDRYWKHHEESLSYYRKYRINNREKIRKIKSRYRKKHKKEIKEYNLYYYLKNKKRVIRNITDRLIKKRYNLTRKDILILKKGQNNKCGVCGIIFSKNVMYNIDHDHHTSKIRGLLCGNCNKAIGFFKENVVYMTRAIKWLKKKGEDSEEATVTSGTVQDKSSYIKDYNLKRKYGITLNRKNRLIRKQLNKCGICKRNLTSYGSLTASVDHNHRTGEIRGILCRNCNSGLGKFKDSIQNIKRAIFWIRKDCI